MIRSLPALILTSVLAMGSAPVWGQTNGDAQSNPNIVRWATGTIEYRTIEAGRLRAREEFRLTVHPDGSRTMRSFVDNWDAGTQLNLIHRVAADFRPLESLMSYWTRGDFKGTGMITVRGSTLTATIDGPLGQVTHSIDVPEKFSVVPHPLATDSWHTWYFDKSAGGEQPTVIYNPQVSPQTGVPLLGHIENGVMTHEGKEDITVPAGTFTTEHYTLNGVIHIWVMAPDNLLVRYAMPSADLEYVLATLTQGP